MVLLDNEQVKSSILSATKSFTKLQRSNTGSQSDCSPSANKSILNIVTKKVHQKLFLVSQPNKPESYRLSFHDLIGYSC